MSLVLRMCTHSSEYMALNSKQKGLNRENIVEFIFDPHSDGAVSVTRLPVMCITDLTRNNSQLHSIKGCKSGVKRQSKQREVPKTTTVMKVVKVIILLPNVSPGTLAWRKEMSAQKATFFDLQYRSSLG